MRKYRVTLIYRYEAVEEVEANTEEEAVSIAMGQAEEQFVCHEDTVVKEIKP